MIAPDARLTGFSLFEDIHVKICMINLERVHGQWHCLLPDLAKAHNIKVTMQPGGSCFNSKVLANLSTFNLISHRSLFGNITMGQEAIRTDQKRSTKL